jgi:8-oxo-dGTP pyrophosphatase MutT (NUDIX family)
MLVRFLPNLCGRLKKSWFAMSSKTVEQFSTGGVYPTGITEKGLKVKESATVVLVRQSGNLPPRKVSRGDFGAAGALYDKESRVKCVFGDQQEAEFLHGWEVLMMQRQAINWIRSTAVDVAPMRYPGEYTFPGGGRDEGETIRETALRELTEELGIDVPDSTLHLFNVRQTRPVRGVSYIMYNFVMLESQNEWIKALNIERINASLREKEEAFEKMRESGEFFNLSAEQRHHFSPEMHDVQWLHLCDAAVNAFTSMNPNLTFVNRWQEEKFLRYNFQRRDPMFVTLQTIVQMDAFHSPSALLDFCKSLGSAEDELGKIQYLYDGMAEEAVFQTFQGKRGGRNEIASMADLRKHQCDQKSRM